MTHLEIRARLDNHDRDADEAFELLRAIGYFHQSSETEESESLDLVVRALDQKELFEAQLSGSGEMIDAIARQAGLYPYLQSSNSWRDQFAVEYMRAINLEDTFFHIEQAKAYSLLQSGKSLVLSAPTSFGKSLLIDALIADNQPSTVVAIVPTIALLDEFRRRMEKRFPDYQIITRTTETRSSEFAIYIGTQERILERLIEETIDLFIIDEFYKLDLDMKDRRALSLNAVLAKYGQKAKQLYLLGPSIDSVPNLEKFRSDLVFYKTKYSPVTANIIDRTDLGPDLQSLFDDLVNHRGENSLIYVQSPNSAHKTVLGLSKMAERKESAFLKEFSEWLCENIHPEWVMSRSIKKGIALHHARIPRAIAYLSINLFNDGKIETIVCTSSMIEGINTAAQNVFIFDGKISTKKLDRFTFDNIKGRAGRLFKHKIGNIYIYNAPPHEDLFSVNIPLLSENDIEPDLLFQVEETSLLDSARSRRRAISESHILPEKLISDWSIFGVENLNLVAQAIQSELLMGQSLLHWEGTFPSYRELEATMAVAWNDLDFSKHDVRTPKQLAFYAFRWYQHRRLRTFFDSLVGDKKELEAAVEIDRGFNFLRGAEYSFPQVLRAINDIVDFLDPELGIDYRTYASQLQNLFLPGELRALDEFGIPLPIIQKLAPRLSNEDLTEARRLIEESWGGFQELSNFEKELIRLAVS